MIEPREKCGNFIKENNNKINREIEALKETEKEIGILIEINREAVNNKDKANNHSSIKTNNNMRAKAELLKTSGTKAKAFINKTVMSSLSMSTGQVQAKVSSITSSSRRDSNKIKAEMPDGEIHTKLISKIKTL